MWDDFHIHHLTNGRNKNQFTGGQIDDVAAFYPLLALSLFTILLAAFVFKLIIEKEQEESAARRDASVKCHLLLW
jgi:hypothetical protein